jgi:hypothetical protein
MYQISLDGGKTVAYTVETVDQLRTLMEELFKADEDLEYISARYIGKDGDCYVD